MTNQILYSVLFTSGTVEHSQAITPAASYCHMTPHPCICFTLLTALRWSTGYWCHILFIST